MEMLETVGSGVWFAGFVLGVSFVEGGHMFGIPRQRLSAQCAASMCCQRVRRLVVCHELDSCFSASSVIVQINGTSEMLWSFL